MKDYDEVVKERYDGTDAEISKEDNTYSLINPVGYAGKCSIDYVVYKIIQYARKHLKKRLSDWMVLDIGCGKGYMTRLFVEFIQMPYNIYGLDYSEKRVEACRNMNNYIHYTRANMAGDDYFASVKFDIITAFDVFMHLALKDDIEKALNKIYNKLAEDGLFIWYDVLASDHFISGVNDDHRGFSIKQMDGLASSQGLELCSSFNVNKLILGKYNSIYLNKYFPIGLVNIINKVYPGKPGNVVRIYRKREAANEN